MKDKITLHRLRVARGTFLVFSMSKGSETGSSSSSSLMLLVEEMPDSISCRRPDVETVSGKRPLPDEEEPREVIFISARRRDGTAHTQNRRTLAYTCWATEPKRNRRRNAESINNQKSKLQLQLKSQWENNEAIDVNSGTGGTVMVLLFLEARRIWGWEVEKQGAVTYQN